MLEFAGTGRWIRLRYDTVRWDGQKRRRWGDGHARTNMSDYCTAEALLQLIADGLLASIASGR